MSWRTTIEAAEQAFAVEPLRGTHAAWVLDACRVARMIGELEGLDAEDERWRGETLADLAADIGTAVGWHLHKTTGGFGDFRSRELVEQIIRYGMKSFPQNWWKDFVSRKKKAEIRGRWEAAIHDKANAGKAKTLIADLLGIDYKDVQRAYKEIGVPPGPPKK